MANYANFQRYRGHGAEWMVRFSGVEADPWVPEDDWVGPGADYPPPGSRALGELHATRNHDGDQLTEVGLGGSHSRGLGLTLLKPSAATTQGWRDWEKTTARNIRIDNIIARLEAAGYSGTVEVAYDDPDYDIPLDEYEEVRRCVPLEWTPLKQIERPYGWSWHDLGSHLKILVVEGKLEHKNYFGTNMWRRKRKPFPLAA